MKSRLKSSGLFFGLIFLAAAIINIVDGIVSDDQSFMVVIGDFAYVDSLLFVSAFMFASAYLSWLSWLQPISFLLMMPFTILPAPNSIYGLGFFVVAVLLFFKLGFYNRNRILKAVLCVAYILALEIAAAFKNGKRFYLGLVPTFFIVAFIAFLFLVFRDRLVVYLKEPKPKLCLEDKGLSEAEQVYVRVILAGRGVKDASFESGVSESTVRNTLSRAYKKLGVVNRAGLVALAEKYEVV
jgi:DNA-binding CsgD family transcriptional regulator